MNQSQMGLLYVEADNHEFYFLDYGHKKVCVEGNKRFSRLRPDRIRCYPVLAKETIKVFGRQHTVYYTPLHIVVSNAVFYVADGRDCFYLASHLGYVPFARVYCRWEELTRRGRK